MRSASAEPPPDEPDRGADGTLASLPLLDVTIADDALATEVE